MYPSLLAPKVLWEPVLTDQTRYVQAPYITSHSQGEPEDSGTSQSRRSYLEAWSNVAFPSPPFCYLLAILAFFLIRSKEGTKGLRSTVLLLSSSTEQLVDEGVHVSGTFSLRSRWELCGLRFFQKPTSTGHGPRGWHWCADEYCVRESTLLSQLRDDCYIHSHSQDFSTVKL